MMETVANATKAADGIQSFRHLLWEAVHLEFFDSDGSEWWFSQSMLVVNLFLPRVLYFPQLGKYSMAP